MSKEGLLLGISLSFPGDADAGMTPWYKEFGSIEQFIDYTNNGIRETYNTDPPKDALMETFKDVVYFWMEEGCVIVIITPEWCKIHENYWAKYGNSPCNDCPQCDEDNGIKDLLNHCNETYNRT